MSWVDSTEPKSWVYFIGDVNIIWAMLMEYFSHQADDVEPMTALKRIKLEL